MDDVLLGKLVCYGIGVLCCLFAGIQLETYLRERHDAKMAQEFFEREKNNEAK